MGEIVSLNKFRKAHARAEETRRSAENRIRHGRTGKDQRRARQITRARKAGR